MRTAMFGGTFNPPHVGHLIAAEHVRTALSIDTILFVPAHVPPHKTDVEIASAEHRLAMLERAVSGNPHFAVTDFEIARGGISYTVDTLRHLRETVIGELFLLIGMDNLAEFRTWRLPEKILELATVVVMTRPGFEEAGIPPDLHSRITICPVPAIGLASRELRERVHQGISIRYLVTDPVARYIEEQNLYRTILSG